MAFSIFDTVYADPCDYGKGPIAPRPGSSVDDLANALASLPNIQVTAPTDITIDGFHGKQLTLTAPASLAGCTLSPDGGMRIWDYPLGATNGMAAGVRDTLWILDVDGQRLVIDAPEPRARPRPPRPKSRASWIPSTSRRDTPTPSPS